VVVRASTRVAALDWSVLGEGFPDDVRVSLDEQVRQLFNEVEEHLRGVKASTEVLDVHAMLAKLTTASSLILEMKDAGTDDVVWRLLIQECQKLGSTCRAMSGSRPAPIAEPADSTNGNTLPASSAPSRAPPRHVRWTTLHAMQGLHRMHCPV